MTFRPSRVLCLGFALCVAAGLAAAPTKFDIAAQPAPAALEQFRKQSKTEVTFNADDLKAVRANAVVGQFEPSVALATLLQNTGYSATQRKTGWFVVVAEQNGKPASIEGAVRDESGRPVSGARVSLLGSALAVETDRRGRFTLNDVPPGAHALAIAAEGMQNTRVTDVSVRSNHRHTLGTITVPSTVAGITQLEDYVVSARKNDGVVELDPYEVSGERDRPFANGNLDIARTINDAQPYYVFDAATIENSGAVDVSDFLKQRLTMNAEAYSSVQNFSNGINGNRSSINLRGLGGNSTLVLVNGRRAAGVFIGTEEAQPDLNGIPLSAIERIEVLPSSASGIYGGSSIGGVVNVLLKRNYRGGEVRLTYDNTFDADAPRRTASLNYGTALEDGRTRFNFSASWSDSEPLRLGDRLDDVRRYRDILQKNRPGHLYSATSPITGALPNITASSAAQTTLTLKNGVVINSRNTHLSAGIGPNTPVEQLYASLAANGGQWNLDYAPTNQIGGLLLGLGASPETQSFNAGLRRQMLPNLEMYAEVTYAENHSTRFVNFSTNSFTVPVSAPTNPFTTAVRVRVPYLLPSPNFVSTQNRGLSVGGTAELPWNWTATVDYTGSESRMRHASSTSNDFTAIPAAVASGALNPFVDALQFPIDMERFAAHSSHRGRTRLHQFSLRGTGPLPQLPWGEPRLTAGLEHRIVEVGEQVATSSSEVNLSANRITRYFPRDSITDAAYAEVSIPLVKEGWRTGLRSLEFQASGRSEHYEVETGTISAEVNPKLPANPPFYAGFTRNGAPFTSTDRYESTNYTLGFKYQPVDSVTIRASRATAFLPPTPLQLTVNPTPSAFPTDVMDPRSGQTVSVLTQGGGDPSLKPQNSVSENVGVIWEPRGRLLKGLRFNLEYFRTQQFDYITSPSAQLIVNQESTFGGRVTRDAQGTITLVDTSYINLFRLENEGWDVSASYQRQTPLGLFGFLTSHSINEHIMTQYDADEPMYDAVGYPSELGAAKYKSNATVTIASGAVSAGWTARYYSSYQQNGSPGGPMHARHLATGSFWDTSWFTAQGGTRIPSQTYHDAFVGYDFNSRASDDAVGWRRHADSLLSGLSVQVGVRNVFNRVPPMDAYFAGNNYFSPYGDIRLRSYWVTVKKAF